MTAPLGIIGLGLLGSALWRRWRRVGGSAVGYDRDPRPLAQLGAEGLAAAGSAREVAERCATVILCLPDHTAVAAAARGPRGFLAAQRPDLTVLDMTTGDPEAAQSMAAEVAASGGVYLEVTVGGSSAELEDGRAILLIGGDLTVYQRCRPLLEGLASQLFYLGPAGRGAQAKLVHNLVLGLQRAVLAEALTLGRQLGLDPRQLLAVLRAGPTYARVMEAKAERMLAQDFTRPVARLRQHLKDVRLILDLGHRCGAPLPLSAVHAQLLQVGVNHGMGDWDNAAVYAVYRQLAGDPVTAGPAEAGSGAEPGGPQAARPAVNSEPGLGPAPEAEGRGL